MILNLLDLSKGDEGKLVANRQRFDPRAMLQEITGEFEQAARERGLTLQATVDCDLLNADTDLLRRTVANLVENALRHGRPDTTVTLACSKKDGATELRVADRGPGVPAELKERVFDAFVQIEGAARPAATMGRGLGLTFCKLAVEAHGGKIWVEDGDPGAVFVVRIPDAA
jgi:signal transduction histidine kinase